MHGLSRKRRGLGVWSVSQEIQGAIALQHQDFRDGTVKIDTFPQVYWAPVEKLYCAGLDDRYRAFERPTNSRMWSFINFSESDLDFAPEAVSSEKLARLRKHIETRVVGKVLEMAEPEEILDLYLSEIPAGGHRAEKYLCLKAWTKRTLELDEEFEHSSSLLNHDEFIQGFEVFYAQLKRSEVAQRLISENRF